MIDKFVATPAQALADVRDGATVMIGGFGNAGMPAELIDALIAQGARELTIVNNNAGNGDTGLAALLKYDLSPYANVGAWVGRCMSRPAAQRYQQKAQEAMAKMG